jgi:hypothetical protein
LMARPVADLAARFERLVARTGPPVDLRSRPIAFRYSCGDCHDSRAHQPHQEGGFPSSSMNPSGSRHRSTGPTPPIIQCVRHRIDSRIGRSAKRADCPPRSGSIMRGRGQS